MMHLFTVTPSSDAMSARVTSVDYTVSPSELKFEVLQDIRHTAILTKGAIRNSQNELQILNRLGVQCVQN